jgi:hypothetical protein
VGLSIIVILRFACLCLGEYGLFKLLSCCSERAFLILMCLVLFCQVSLASSVKLTSNEFPSAVVLWRYDLFQDTHWTVFNETVGQLKNLGFDIVGDVNHVVQANYTYLNYTLKSKVVRLSWPNATLQVTQGTYDLNLTAYKVMNTGAIGDRAGSFLRSNLPAILIPPSTYKDPDLGVGFDPSVFTIGNTFVASTRTYTVNRTETLNDTLWGKNDTYVCLAHLTNATHSYSWTSWCDAASGLFLKNVAEAKTPTSTSYEQQEMIETGVENDRFDVVQNGQSYQVFVHTNSTLDDFEFDSSVNTLSLAVDGPSGTSGICNITIPNGLVPAGNGFEVYVDGQKANHTLTEDVNSYYVSVSYQHSAHAIKVDIVGGTLLTAWWIWATVTVIIVIVAGAVYFSRKKHHRSHHRTRS